MISSMAKKEEEEPGGGKKTEKGRRWGRDVGGRIVIIMEMKKV